MPTDNEGEVLTTAIVRYAPPNGGTPLPYAVSRPLIGVAPGYAPSGFFVGCAITPATPGSLLGGRPLRYAPRSTAQRSPPIRPVGAP